MFPCVVEIEYGGLKGAPSESRLLLPLKGPASLEDTPSPPMGNLRCMIQGEVGLCDRSLGFYGHDSGDARRQEDCVPSQQGGCR